MAGTAIFAIASMATQVYSAKQAAKGQPRAPQQMQTEKAPNVDAFRNRARSAPGARAAGSTILTGGGLAGSTAGTTLLGG